MIFASDWRVDPDGRDTEDRKNGPVISYKLSPEEIEKIAKGAKVMTKVMTEESAKYEAGREITLQADVKKNDQESGQADVRERHDRG